MYFDGVGVAAGTLARLSLPIKTPATRSCFSFYYSMVSRGQLKVRKLTAIVIKPGLRF